jgi:hypothetical protein
MITKILITPNSNDDWSTTSPFYGYVINTELGFCISNVHGEVETNYIEIPHVLLSMSSINRSVDIFANNKLEKSATVEGIGGVAKVGDWSFSLETLSSTLSPLKLMGRNITIKVEDTVVFTGKIYNTEVGFDNVKFIVRSNFLINNKEIGTIVESEIESSNNKIIPVIYGDFTDTDSYIPLVVDLESDHSIKAYTSERTLKEVTNVFVWDEKRTIADQCTNSLEDLTIDVTNKEITFKKATGATLFAAITDTDAMSYIDLDITPTIGIKFTGSLSVSVGDIFQNTNSGINYYEYIGMVGDTYLFKVGKRLSDIGHFKFAGVGNFDLLKPTTTADAFINVVTSVTYTVDSYSDVIVPELFARQIDGNIHATQPSFIFSSNALVYDVDNMVCSRIIQIDNEKMSIYQSLPVWVSGSGIFSRHEVIRGYSGTTIVTHTISTVVYSKQETNDDTEYTLKMKTIFPLLSISNWNVLLKVTYRKLGTDFTAYPMRNIREVATVNYLNQFFINCKTRTYANALTILLSDLSALDYSEYFDETYTVEQVVSTILLDLDFGNTVALDGKITGMWLLGYFNMDHSTTQASGGDNNPPPDARNGIALGMRTASESPDYKRVGVNLYHAQKMGIIEKNGKLDANYSLPGEWTGFNDYDLLLGLTELSNWDLFHNSDTFSLYSNRPVIGTNCWEKSYPLSGIWSYTGGVSQKYTNGTVDEPKMPQTLEDLLKQRFVLQLFSCDANDTAFYLDAISILAEYTIDVRDTELYFQGKGRVWDGSLLTNPSDIIADLLEYEMGLDNIDATSFAFVKTNTADQTCAFTVYDNPIKSSELLNNICREQGLILGELPNGDMCLFTLSMGETPTTIDDSDILLNEGENRPDYSESITGLENLITGLNIKYKKRYTDEVYTQQYAGTGYTDSENYLDQTRLATFEAETIRDVDTAEILNDLCVAFYNIPMRQIVIKCNPENTMTLVPGKLVNFSSDAYVKNSDGCTYLVLGTDFQPGYNNTKPEVELTLLQLDVVSYGTPDPVIPGNGLPNIGAYQTFSHIGVYTNYPINATDTGNPGETGDPASNYSLNIGCDQNGSTSNIGL